MFRRKKPSTNVTVVILTETQIPTEVLSFIKLKLSNSFKKGLLPLRSWFIIDELFEGKNLYVQGYVKYQTYDITNNATQYQVVIDSLKF